MFTREPADAPRLIEFELPSGMTQRGGFALIVCGFTVDLGAWLLRVRAPEAARAHGFERAVQRSAVFLK
jgi:hypothetical protein